ncbi:hypothetical protein D9615_002093 [Tricholomella constricta]|uniref:DUF6593 domain-containing protein n=1 Tax=Tricholomella constricta TaxID=117010 RepID=A0A8H5MAC0_9AGAR|nr:hypothetical protein D9615_002093 [Tricholomella constricta]
MHLYLSTRSPLNSVFSTAEGQALYKVETPMAAGTRTSTISCIVPNDIPQHHSAHTVSMQNRFGHLAQVEHNVISSSILRFGGNEFATKDYFRKVGWGPLCRARFEKLWVDRHRVFTGPDGREYKWELLSYNSQLVTNDDKKTLVARFHRASLGIIGKARPASFEISPTGEHMVQDILITFIYIEKIRKDMET